MVHRSTIFNLVKHAVHEVDNDAKIILFGSRARGDSRKDSDWDFLILLNQKVSPEIERKIIDNLFQTELQTEQIFMPVIYNQSDWTTKYSITALFQNIKNEGILI